MTTFEKVAVSNRIEGIDCAPTAEELVEHDRVIYHWQMRSTRTADLGFLHEFEGALTAAMIEALSRVQKRQ